ncbi:hypothetical protein [Streptomyces sp. WM6378]|uniref:hypothetical protein n=1 Tax=Streptomyces sp. WM6378 TaxID=1415557 RepID=UPI0006B03E3C|nr:hypothetical protein ADK54_41875 [Streptomyces sp. WM6378]
MNPRASLYSGLGLQRARVAALSLRAEGLTGAEHAHHQLLLDPGDDKKRTIEQVADAARQKFGAHVIRPATLAGPPGTLRNPARRRSAQ